MGVPAFFRWLTKKYPSIAVQCIEEKSKFNDCTNEKIPVDTTKPNPNDVEFDNLYLDMNGIIHPCTHPEDRPAPKNEDEMMVIIFEFIDRIFSIVRPRKLLYMAIDGVAPRAKMNQQRSRRFRAAKDTTEKSSEIKRIKEQIIANGGVVPPDVPQSEKFDSNCITPGTPFMHKLAECLRYYVYDRLNNDPGWKNLTVILSDANVPGEGEHKIMDFIRRQRAQPDHDPNTHHVLCGADADLIMLGLATHEPYFTIIREEFRADKPRPCEICNQYGHDTKECTGMTREKAGAHDEMAGNTFTPAEQRYIFLRLNVLREYLSKELTMTNLSFEFDIERAIDDWVFMCFFVGNDFLPHLPSLEIREGAIDRLVNLYKGMISKAGGYLTDCGDVNLERVQVILSGIGEVEDEIFKKRQRNEVEFRQRQKEKKKRQRVGYDMPIQMPEWMKSGPFAPMPLGQKKPSQNLIPVSNNKFESLDKSTEDVDESDDAKRGIKRKMDGAASASTSDATPMEQNPAEEKQADQEVVMVEEEVDEDANDPVRLWEDGWKQRYYKIKFDVDEDDIDFKIKVAHHYTIGLQWVLKYYYQGVPSWNWYFPYHYAPFASDFIDISEAAADFGQASEPFKPFEQLMAVFPAASRKHVPPAWQNLMTDPNSVIIDFYPEDFQVDLNGKKQSWQGVALLPFVDEQRLKRALEPLHDRLSPEELKRNTRGNDRLFVGKSHKLYEVFKQAYADREAGTSKDFKNLKHSIELDPKLCGGIAGKAWRDEYVVLENETFLSPLRHSCPNLENNRVFSVHYHDPMYDSDHIFKANILEGAKIPDATLRPEDFEPQRGYRPNTGFGRNNDYRNNRNPNVANRMIQNTLGGSGDNSVVSSAYGGHGSLYGSYKSSNQYSNSNNNNNYNNNYNNNNSSGNRNNNYNNNNNPRNNNSNSNYYSNSNPNNNNNNNRGNNYNYNNNNNNNYNNNQGYNYNNNNNNNNRNNYNNNSYQQNKPQSQHTRFNDGANNSNSNSNQGQNRSNRQQN